MDNHLLELFERYARAAGAQVSVASDPVEAAEAILGIVDPPVRCAAAARQTYPGVFQALESGGLNVSTVEEIAHSDLDRSALAAALAGGTGIVLARAGVAETGSVILADDALAPRLLGMLSEICVALLAATSILPGLDEAAAMLADLDRAGHRYVSLVTGPSRTADIERVLTIGVQGPKALHIIVLSYELN